MWKLHETLNLGFDDSAAKKSLVRYFAVAENRLTAKFKIAQKVPAEFSPDAPLETLWVEHRKRIDEF
jgi:uncharacterized Fe-S radical SAM superfamily protein PflX